MRWSAVVLETDTDEIKVVTKATRKGDVTGDYVILFYKYDVEAAIEYGKHLFDFIDHECLYFIGRKNSQMTDSKYKAKTDNDYSDYEVVDDDDTDFSFSEIWESEDEFTSKLTGEVYNKIKHWEGV